MECLELKLVRLLCNERGRRVEPGKVRWIFDWAPAQTIEDVRAFVGIVLYYQIFVRDLAITTEPVFDHFPKGKAFLWTVECQLAIDSLKKTLTEPPVLISLQFRFTNRCVFEYRLGSDIVAIAGGWTASSSTV